MCSVCGCDSWRRSAQSFKLPEDPERRLEWVMYIAEVNKQRFKESSWTDIAVCSEHFAGECFVNVSGSVQLKPGAVPSLCVSSGPDKPVGSPGCEVSVNAHHLLLHPAWMRTRFVFITQTQQQKPPLAVVQFYTQSHS